MSTYKCLTRACVRARGIAINPQGCPNLPQRWNRWVFSGGFRRSPLRRREASIMGGPAVLPFRQVFLSLRADQIALPYIDTKSPGQHQLRWKPPVYATVSNLLTNPVYALCLWSNR
jgi:hypothetical protein